jgi:ketosteroid isomerase-like protein
MKCTALCLIGLLWSTGTAAQSRPAPSDQEILVQLERDWDRAFWAKDITFIRNVIADEFMTTYDDGSRGDKAKEIELAEQFSQKVESSTLDDFTVKVYGDTAVVFFTRHLVGPVGGQRTEMTFRFLDVFVWRADRWQCVATQSTKVTG